MIYQSQFSDYNNQLYSVELETPPIGQESQWFTIFDDTIYANHQEGWLSYSDTSDYNNNTSYGMNESGFSISRHSYISWTLPDGQYWFVIDPLSFNGIERGDIIEIRFKFKGFQDQIRGNGIQHTYGIKFGHIIASRVEGQDVFELDDYIDLGAFASSTMDTSIRGDEYSYTYQANGTSLEGTSFDYLGFLIRNTNCNCFKVRDLVIYNKTRGTSFVIQDSTHQWQLQNYYISGGELIGGLHMDISDDYNQANMMVGVDRKENQDNEYFGGAYYFQAWCNSNDNFYTFDNCEYQENRQFRYPDFHIYKPVSLRKGYMYNVKVIYKSKQGAGCNIYLMKNGNVVASEPLHKTSGDDSALVIFQTTLTDDVDEIRIGSIGGNYQRDFYVYRVLCERLEINQTRVDVTLGGEPFTVELQGDDEDLFKPIRNSIATATIVSDQYLFNLYSNSNNIQVRLIKGDYDGEIEWLGVVKPLMFDMGYNQELEEIQIECQDYISSLENIHLTDIDIITNHPIMSFGELFNKILFENTKYTKLWVPDLVNFDMLSTYRISTKNFIDDDCKIITQNNQTTVLYADKNWSLYKILEEMCKYMGVTLVVEGEDVILIPYLQLQFTYTFKKYQIGVELSYLGNGFTKKHDKSVVDIYDSSTLSLSPVLNKFSVKTKTNKVKEIIPDFLDDDNVENITNVPVWEQVRWETSIDLGEYEFEDDKKYQCDVKMMKTKSDKCTNYTYTQIPKPTKYTDYDYTTVHKTTNYPVIYSGLINSYCGGIIDFRAIEEKDEVDSNLKSNAQVGYDRYLVFCKGKDDNISYQPIYQPCFKIVSDEMEFTNKMALQISANLIQTPYVKASTMHDVENVFEQVPIERDKDMHISFRTRPEGESNAYTQTNRFCYVHMLVKIGDYCFHNVGDFFSTKDGQPWTYPFHFFRKGWWERYNSYYEQGGADSPRLQFDNEENEWAFGKSMGEVDNSGDSGINQDSSGYWIMFNANEDQSETQTSHKENHVDLPEKFTGRLEIIFYPNDTQAWNDDNRLFGVDIQFLKDLKVKLVVPRNMEYTEDEWNSETQIDAVIDSESLRKAETIEVEMHTDFGKCPSYSVVMGAHDYQIINMNEGSHCAEEWIVYNYTNQYSDVRKVLDTSVNGEIHPYSLITMTGRSHFGKMVVDSYKKDYRTGYTKVKLIEICNLQEQI